MPNTGLCSIELNCNNNTQASLTVQQSSAVQGCTWIAGESAKQGSVLQQYQSAIWGVMTEQAGALASGQISLTGLGKYPVVIVFSNTPDGSATCESDGNGSIAVTAVQIAAGAHAQFQVTLIPSMAPKR